MDSLDEKHCSFGNFWEEKVSCLLVIMNTSSQPLSQLLIYTAHMLNQQWILLLFYEYN